MVYFKPAPASSGIQRSEHRASALNWSRSWLFLLQNGEFKLILGTSPQTPGIFRMGPNSKEVHARGNRERVFLRLRAQPALGLLPSRALPSGQAVAS